MEAKKTKKADLESKRTMFFQIGLVIALGLVLIAFNWDNHVRPTDVFGKANRIEDEKFDLPPITRPEEKKELPKPTVVEVIEIVDDKTPDINSVLEINSEATAETKIDIGSMVKEEVDVVDPIFIVGTLDENPEFPGGMVGLLKYLTSSVKYPTFAQEQGIQGTVYLSFIINKDGKVVDVKVIRGVDSSLDKEALRVVNSLPNWKPGRQNGRPVRVSYQVPMKFYLQM